MKRIGLILVIILLLGLISEIYSFNGSEKAAAYVSGRVLDERNFPLPFAKIIINGAETETDKAGRFKILNVSFPYDLTIAEKSTATAVIYKGLSIDNPELTFFGLPDAKNENIAFINVTFPEIPAGSSAVLKFISTDVFNCEDKEAAAGEKSKTLTVLWPQSKKNISGSIVFIQKSSKAYEQYKNKVVSLYKNTLPFKVNLNDLSSSNTETSELVVYLPFKDYTTKGYSIYADFFAYNRNSQVLLNREEGNFFRTKCIIPTALPIAYRLKVSGYVEYRDGSGFVNYEYSKPGSSINLSAEIPPEPQTPSDKFLGANGNTEFYYTLGSGTGIYVLQYRCNNPVMNFYIVTSERSAYLSYLSRKEFKQGVSIEFTWNVNKYLTYFSVNDFVKPKEFNNDIGYKAVLYSKERTFKTGYY